jgi:hypothetical protein
MLSCLFVCCVPVLAHNFLENRQGGDSSENVTSIDQTFPHIRVRARSPTHHSLPDRSITLSFARSFIYPFIYAALNTAVWISESNKHIHGEHERAAVWKFSEFVNECETLCPRLGVWLHVHARHGVAL